MAGVSRAITGRRGVVLGAVASVGLLAVALAGALTGSPTRAFTSSPHVPPLTVTNVALGIGADESQRSVAWYGADPDAGCVEYAEATSSHPFSGWVTTATAYASGDAVARDLTWFHATMTDLEPSTRYAYRFGDCAGTWSAPFEFSTQDAGSFSFWLFGDPQVHATTDGAGDGWASTLEQAARRFPGTDFMLTAGDHVSGPGASLQAGEWNVFLRPHQFTEYAVAPTIGNHDETDGTGTQYGQHFALPNLSNAGETAEGSGDYWFTYNGALFMILNSMSLDVAGHRAFMEAAMAANPGAGWDIVSLHRAPYSAGPHVSEVKTVSLRENLTPVLSELGIDLVLSGHDHCYARSYLMDGTAVVPDSGGPTLRANDGEVLYVAANSASGGRFYDVTGTPEWIAVANQERVPNYSDIRVSRYSIVITTYRVPDGSVVDSVTLGAREVPQSAESPPCAERCDKARNTSNPVRIIWATEMTTPRTSVFMKNSPSPWATEPEKSQPSPFSVTTV